MRKMLRHKIADFILADYVRSGEFAAGDALPTVRHLQKRYGVSSGTVLSALAILETQGIIVSRHGSGCYLSEQSAGTHENGNGCAKLIGLVCNIPQAEINERLHSGVDSASSRAGYSVIVASTNFSYEQEQVQVKRLIDVGCDGIVLYPVVRTKEQARNDYLNSEHQDFPIVLIDLALPTHKRCQVLFDNYRAGYDMTCFLMDRGHQRVAFMDYGTEHSEFLHRSVMDRYNGHLAAVQARGKAADVRDRWILREQMHEDPTRTIAQMLMNWMEQIDRPTALITLEDNRAARTISIALELGIRVPGDLEIVGFDDLPVGRVIRPPFTTTTPDFARAGELAVEMLLQLTKREIDSTMVYILPVPIKPRELVSLDCVVAATPTDRASGTV